MPQKPKSSSEAFDLSDLSKQGDQYDLSDLAPKPLTGKTVGAGESLEQDPGVVRELWNVGSNRAIGLGKKLLEIGDAPSRLAGTILEWAGVPAGKKLSTPLPELQPKPGEQEWGSKAGELLSWLPMGPWEERAAASLVPKIASGVRNPALLRTINALTRGAIGGASGAGMAFANEQNPKQGAIWGAAAPAIATTVQEPFTAAGRGMQDWSNTSYARAIEPTGIYGKEEAANAVDLLRNEGALWARKSSLPRMAQQIIDYAAPRKEFYRRLMGNDPVIEWAPLVQKLQNASDKLWKTGRMQADPRQVGAVAGERIGPEIAISQGPEAAYYNEMQEYLKELQQQTVQDANGNLWIPIDRLDAAKRAISTPVAQSHGYSQMPDVRLATQKEVWRVASNIERKHLNEAMPSEWATMNDLIHQGINLRDLGTKGATAEVGRRVPVSEEPFIGFGARDLDVLSKAGIAGAVMRTLRGLKRRPIYETPAGFLKNKVAYELQRPGQLGFDVANVREAIDALTGGESGTPQPEKDLTQQKVIVPNKPAVVKWDRERQVMVPVQQ